MAKGFVPYDGGPLVPSQAKILYAAGYTATQIKELKKDPKKLNAILLALFNDGVENGDFAVIGDAYAGPLGSSDGTYKPVAHYKYPQDTILDDTDYVLFQFGKYIPPFSNDAMDTAGANINQWTKYNASTTLNPLGPSIMLPMPQDLGNELAQSWEGKQFSSAGRSAVALAAAGNASFAMDKLKGDANITALQASITGGILNKLPGVAGNIQFNDITGSTRGIVLNPNAELLYDSPELREIGMSWKMVPRNTEEAEIIQQIVKAFRGASLPSWGEKDYFSTNEAINNITFTGLKVGDKEKQMATLPGSNFIHVPNMCKFTFMTGNRMNTRIIQFKPCAISKVQVNYTPDGTYTSYHSGDPVATELTLNFIESKIVFAHEIKDGF
tara:strand:- start:1767 stop:2918 length:1152 start_codon:yes stop_codon:yes gene_type:complete